MACLPWILGTLLFAAVDGDEITDFLERKEELKPQRYNGDIVNDWDIYIKRDPKPFKLSSSSNDEEPKEMSLGLPVSQDVIFSRRRSVVDDNNVLSRNDVDEVFKQIEPADVAPTYTEVKGKTGAQVLYFVVVYVLCSLFVSLVALAGFVVVRSVRSARAKPALTEEESVGTTRVADQEGAEITICDEEQPGPSNVAIEIDSPSTTTTESENTENDTNSSSGSEPPYQTVTILQGETQL